MNTEHDGKLAFRTKQFALLIIDLYSALPKSTVAQVLGRQLLRSGTSVGAQYREAMRAKSIADFSSKVEGALQEIEETSYWLDLIVDSRSLDSSRLAMVRKESDELTAMLVASVRTAKRKRG